MTERTPLYNPEAPLFLFKTGVIGADPLDFMPNLASVLDAAYISWDQIKLTMINQIKSMQIGRPNTNGQLITETLLRQTTTELRAANDVVGDVFFNTPEHRKIAVSTAHTAGALAINLNVCTPFGVAKQRVQEWAEAGMFTIPIKDWRRPPQAVTRTMMSSLQMPTPNENLPYILNINGLMTTQQMVDRVLRFLEKRGLVEPN